MSTRLQILHKLLEGIFAADGVKVGNGKHGKHISGFCFFTVPSQLTAACTSPKCADVIAGTDPFYRPVLL